MSELQSNRVRAVIRWAKLALNVMAVFTVAFSAALIFSALRLDVKVPQTTGWTVQGNSLMVSVPYEIDNGGLFAISTIGVRVEVYSESGRLLLKKEFYLPEVSPRGSSSGSVNLTWDLSSLLNDPEIASLLVRDANLTLRLSVNTTYAKFLRVSLRSVKPIPWRAPLRDLSVEVMAEELSIRRADGGLELVVPVKYSHSGWITLRNVPISYTLSYPAGEVASGNLTIEELSRRGTLEIVLPISREFAETLLLNETTLYVLVDVGPVSISREMPWKPPLQNMTISEPRVSILGQVARITSEVSFYVEQDLLKKIHLAAVLLSDEGELARVEREFERVSGPVSFDVEFRIPLAQLERVRKIRVVLIEPLEVELVEVEA